MENKEESEIVSERLAMFRRNFVTAKGRTTEEALENLKEKIKEELLPRLIDVTEATEGALLIAPLSMHAASCGCGCGCGGGAGGGGGGGSAAFQKIQLVVPCIITAGTEYKYD